MRDEFADAGERRAREAKSLWLSATRPTPKGGFITPEENGTTAQDSRKVLIGLEDRTLACAWALRNPDSHNVFSIGQMDSGGLTYMIASNEAAFMKGLCEENGAHGGYIHEVSRREFSLQADSIGQIKQFSDWPAEVVANPQFISLQDAMKAGVQVFVLDDPAYVEALVKGRRNHREIIQEALALDPPPIRCLNEKYGYAPVILPARKGSNAPKVVR